MFPISRWWRKTLKPLVERSRRPCLRWPDRYHLPRLERLEDRTLLSYAVNLDNSGGPSILTISEANAGDNSNLMMSLAGTTFMFADTTLTFNPATGNEAALITNNVTNIMVDISNVDQIFINLGTGTDVITLGNFSGPMKPLTVTDVGLAGDAVVQAGGSGIQVTGGVSITGFDSITVDNQITTTGGAGSTVTLAADALPTSTLSISATGSISSTGAVTLTGNGSIATSGPIAATQDISLDADNMTIGSTINAGSSSISLDAVTAGQIIDIGGPNTATRLGLTQLELNQLTAGIVRIGDAANTGGIEVTDNIVAPPTWDTLSLQTSGTITEPGGSLTVTNLAAQGSSGVSLDALGNTVNTLAGATSVSLFNFINSTTLSVGTVDGVTGIVSGGGDITLCTTTGDINLNTPINAGAGTVGLSAAGSVTQQVATAIITAGNLGVLAGGSVTLDTGINQVTNIFAANAGSFVFFQNGPNFSIGTVLPTGCFLGASGVSSGGNIAICNGTGTLNINAPLTSGGTVGLTSAGGVTQAATAVITAANLGVLAAGPVTLDVATNQVNSNFAAQTTGAVRFLNAPSFTVGMVGMTGCFIGANGIRITTVGSPVILTVNSAGNQITVAANGIVTSSGAIILTADQMSFSSAVNAGTARVTLQPFTVARIVDLGTASPGVLGLTNTSLGQVTAGVLQIGNTITDTGTIRVSQTITAPAQWNTLSLQTRGAITQTGGSLMVTNLAVQGASGVTLDSTSNAVNVLAGRTNGPAFVFVDANGLTIATVDAVAGIATGAGDITLCNQAGDLNIDAPITTTGTVRLSSAGGIIQNASGLITAGNLGLLAAGPITLDVVANQVATAFAANDTGAGNAVRFRNAGSLTIDQILPNACFNPAAVGVTANNAPFVLTLGGALTVNQAINVGIGAPAVVTIFEVGTATFHETASATDITANIAVVYGTGAANALTINYANGSVFSINQAGAGGFVTNPKIAVTQAGLQFQSIQTFTGGPANDTFNIGAPGGFLNGVLGTITINGGGFVIGTSGDVVRLFDQGNLSSGNTYTLTANTFTTSSGLLNYNNVAQVELYSGTGGGNTINVTNTGGGGITRLFANGTSDTVNITTTGSASTTAVFCQGGNDTVNVNGTGTSSGLAVLGGSGQDIFNVSGTGTGSVTSIQGGSGRDTFNIGGAANSLNNVLGVLSLDGIANNASFHPNSRTCNGATFSVPGGNILNLSDQGNGIQRNYFLSDTALTSNGTSNALNITYHVFQTIRLQSGTSGANMITVSATVANAFTQITANGDGDALNLNSVGAGSIDELLGGNGNHQFNVNLGPPVSGLTPQPFLNTQEVGTGTITLTFSAFDINTYQFISTGPNAGYVRNKNTGVAVLCFSNVGSIPQNSFTVSSFLLPSTDQFGRAQFQIVLSGFFFGTATIPAPTFAAVVAQPSIASQFGFSAPSVAVADVEGIGTPDLIVGFGQGFLPVVEVFNIVNIIAQMSTTPVLKAQFFAYDSSFPGGVFVAGGIVSGNGTKADIVTGAGRGGGPHVEVWQYAPQTFNPNVFPAGGVTLYQSYFAYDAHFNFFGGVRVAVGNITGDMKNGEVVNNVITGAGPGGGPHVRVFDSLNQGVVRREFFAYDPSFNFFGGIYVAAGHYVTAHTRDEIMTGAGFGGGPHVKIFDMTTQSNPPPVIASFFAFGPTSGFSNFPDNPLTAGVSGVAFAFIGNAVDIVVGSGLGQPAETRVFLNNGANPILDPNQDFLFVFVNGSPPSAISVRRGALRPDQIPNLIKAGVYVGGK
jgi:hypothetical protein